jgi:hypothetical protein
MANPQKRAAWRDLLLIHADDDYPTLPTSLDRRGELSKGGAA